MRAGDRIEMRVDVRRRLDSTGTSGTPLPTPDLLEKIANARGIAVHQRWQYHGQCHCPRSRPPSELWMGPSKRRVDWPSTVPFWLAVRTKKVILLDRSRPTIASFVIDHRRFLTPDGEVVADLPPFANDPAQLIRLSRAMVLTRAFDAKAIALQ